MKEGNLLTIHSTEHLFPEGFIDETLRTLSILFPAHDRLTENWFSKIALLHSLDQRAMRCKRVEPNHRRIETFTFWRDRMIILKEVFEESTPKTVSQLWSDRRSPTQWWTFWIVLILSSLSVFLGLVQVVLSAAQLRNSTRTSEEY
jgi:hypothetical protein